MNNRNVFLIPVLGGSEVQDQGVNFQSRPNCSFLSSAKGKHCYKTLYRDPIYPTSDKLYITCNITQYTNIWRFFIQIVVQFPGTLGSLYASVSTPHPWEDKGRSCWGQIPTATPTCKDFLRLAKQQFLLLPTLLRSRSHHCQKKGTGNSSQQCSGSHLSHIKRWKAHVCLISHVLVAFHYLFRTRIVPILLSFHVPGPSQAHACLVTSTACRNRPAGRKPRAGASRWQREDNMDLRNGSTGVLRRLYRGCLTVSAQEPVDSASRLSSVAGPRAYSGHTGPTLGLFQNLFSGILLLSLKPSLLTSKILKTTSPKFLLSSIHKVSNIYWHQLCV